MRWLVSIVLLAVVAGCGGEENPSSQPVEQAAAEPPAQRGASTPADSERYIRCPVRAVSLKGEPLEDMIPIATISANAFEPPIAKGEPTGASGESEVHVPQGMEVHVRAWDPTLNYFANNFYTVMPTEGNATDVMEVVMVEGAMLNAVFLDGDGDPLAKTAVRLMLSHPVEGPWWPSETVTSEAGEAVFPTVPAGQYVARFETQDGAFREVPNVTLEPDGRADLGPVVLE